MKSSRLEHKTAGIQFPHNVSNRILIAGIGNIFLGDDVFGMEVVRALAQQVMRM